MANRIWHWHFGRGIVPTVSDFGLMGAEPTHPQLLDWLADEFVKSGWSIKHLHRLIMLSSAYRQASTFNDRNAALDPDNTYLWRFEPRRLEVEALYDAMLTSIGKVERQRAGSELDVFKSEDRALYVLTSGRSPVGLGVEIRKMFPLFDFDDTGVAIQNRERSVTAAQALWWLNNPLPKHFAGEFAKRLLAMPGDDAHRVKQMHLIALSRPPSPQQVQRTLDYVQHCVENEGMSEPDAWARVCLAIYSSNEFKYLD
jgi:hypothetical protein